MNSSIKFIYFDLAGVQYNFSDGLTKFVQQQGISYQDFAKQVAHAEELANKGEIPVAELVEVYNKVLRLHIASEHEYLDIWTSFFQSILPIHELVQQLSKTYLIGLLTNIHEGLLQKLVERKLIVNIPYHSVIQSFQIHQVKPEEEIYLTAQRKAQVKPDEIFFIDDNEAYVQAARKLGWKGMVFNQNNITQLLAEIKHDLV